MPLENPKNPPEQAIDYIDAFLQPGDPSPDNLRQQQYWQWTFTLGLEELAKANAKLPDAAVGWRYEIGDGSGQALSATVDSKNKLVGLSRGPAVSSSLSVASELRTLPEAAEDDYEIRLLTIPGLLTEAFWLKSLDNKPDLIVPFSTAQKLRLGHPYHSEVFLNIMRPLAKDWLAGWTKVKEREAANKALHKKRSEALQKVIATQPAELREAVEIQIRAKARQSRDEKRANEKQEKLIAKQRRIFNLAIDSSKKK